jgi:sulfur transfer protein SufE
MTADAMTISEAQDEIVEEFELFGDDADMRNSYIIDLGRKLPPMPPEYHTEDYIVKGWPCAFTQAGRRQRSLRRRRTLLSGSA